MVIFGVDSFWVFTAIIGLTAIERLVELRVSNRNAQWSFAQGGQEFGKAHYPFMVVLHTAFLFACIAEVCFFSRTVSPLQAGFFFVLAIASQLLRWWCISHLGQQWNTRVIIVPGLRRIQSGPYRFFSHPNYLAVVIEGIALPLLHNAWLTAITFTLLNAALLRVRLNVENQALTQLHKKEAAL